MKCSPSPSPSVNLSDLCTLTVGSVVLEFSTIEGRLLHLPLSELKDAFLVIAGLFEQSSDDDDDDDDS